MYKRQIKYHFFIGEKKPRRTTITVDLLLFEFMALKLGIAPDDDEAYSTVRLWIQDNIISTLDDSDERKNISQHVRQMLIHEIVQVKLTNRRDAWLDETG